MRERDKKDKWLILSRWWRCLLAIRGAWECFMQLVVFKLHYKMMIIALYFGVYKHAHAYMHFEIFASMVRYYIKHLTCSFHIISCLYIYRKICGDT